jgi:hypothetical protein
LSQTDNARGAKGAWLFRRAPPGAPAAPSSTKSVSRASSSGIAGGLAAAARDASQAFWPDDLSLLEEGVLDRQQVLGHRQATRV